MRFISILIALAVVVVTSPADAAYKRMYRNLKLPTQQLVEKLALTGPAAASSTANIASTVGDTTGVDTAITTGITDPDFARALVVCPTLNTADVAAGDVTIAGTNYLNESITDTITFIENDIDCRVGTKAFKTITSVTFPAEDSPYGASWSVGTTDVLGLDKCMGGDHYMFGTFNDVYEGTRATVTYDVDDVESNTIDLNSALDGSDVELYFIQNYRCNP